jgi:hypothetical protein
MEQEGGLIHLTVQEGGGWGSHDGHTKLWLDREKAHLKSVGLTINFNTGIFDDGTKCLNLQEQTDGTYGGSLSQERRL